MPRSPPTERNTDPAVDPNIRLHVELSPITGPARKLRLRDDTSDLVIADLTLDAEQFTRLLAGNTVEVDGWFSPEHIRQRIGRKAHRISVRAARSAGIERVQEWAETAVPLVGADTCAVVAANTHITAQFVIYADPGDRSPDRDALTSRLIAHGRQVGGLELFTRAPGE